MHRRVKEENARNGSEGVNGSQAVEDGGHWRAEGKKWIRLLTPPLPLKCRCEQRGRDGKGGARGRVQVLICKIVGGCRAAQTKKLFKCCLHKSY